MNDKYQVIVIGAGPAGLACGGRLSREAISYVILEKENDFASSWRRHYDRLCLHTVGKYSRLPFKEFPAEFPVYVPKDDLVKYYESYVSEFKLNIQTNREVLAIEKSETGWVVQCSGSKEYLGEHVIVATGFNRKPNYPVWKGLDSFSGEVVHSKDYKNARAYSGKTVLVVGMGNSGAEISLDLAENNVHTLISVRSPVNIVPRDFLGNPTQVTAKKLAILPTSVSDWIGKQVRNLSIGNLSKYGIETPDIAPARQLREQAKTPVLDLGTVKAIKDGRITVVKGVNYLDGDSAILDDGTVITPDAIIQATGFSPGITDFFASSKPLLNDSGVPKQISAEGDFSGVHFVGFDAYSNGILESIYNDSKIVVENISRSL